MVFEIFIITISLLILGGCILKLVNILYNKNTISFKESMDLTELPIITFYNNGVKLNFLLDTGSNVSHINSSVLNKLEYVRSNEEISTVGFTGEKVISNFCKMNLTYKDKKYEDDFSITDLDEAFNTIKQESGVQIHGIIGSKFFERYKYVLDFSKLIAYSKI